MEFVRIPTWEDALAARAAYPGGWPIAGGTDVMVRLHRGGPRPDALLDLSRVPQLVDWTTKDGVVRIGAGVTYARIVDELDRRLPALAIAARSVGSAQIRHRGTIGGCLGSASPDGDAHPCLLAAGALVEVASLRGTRTIAVADFYTGTRRTALAADELIAAVVVPIATGPEWFSRVGSRQAFAGAVASFALSLRPRNGRVGTGSGATGPVPHTAATAEEFLAAELAAAKLWESRDALPESLAHRFGELVASAAAPVDDIRGTASYRRRALAVLARRSLERAWSQNREA